MAADLTRDRERSGIQQVVNLPGRAADLARDRLRPPDQFVFQIAFHREPGVTDILTNL